MKSWKKGAIIGFVFIPFWFSIGSFLMMLAGKTPSEEAKINLGLGHNKWKGLIEKTVQNKTLEKIVVKEEIVAKTRLDYWA